MSTVMVPANAGEALGMLESATWFLAGLEAADIPAEALAEYLRRMERADAVQAAARGRLLPPLTRRTGRWATGSGAPGPGWCTACG